MESSLGDSPVELEVLVASVLVGAAEVSPLVVGSAPVDDSLSLGSAGAGAGSASVVTQTGAIGGQAVSRHSAARAPSRRGMRASMPQDLGSVVAVHDARLATVTVNSLDCLHRLVEAS